MSWFTVAAVSSLLLLPGIVQSEAAPPFEPVCALPNVLRVVALALEARGLHGELDPGSVGERSAPDSVTALCSVKVLTAFYDSNRFGDAPQYQMVVHSYEVRHRSKSVFVKLLD